jgi:hypothetical protein
VRLPRPPQPSRQRLEAHRYIGVGPVDRHCPGHRHPARGLCLAHRVPQVQPYLVAPHDPLSRLQAGGGQAFCELSSISKSCCKVPLAWAHRCCQGPARYRGR